MAVEIEYVDIERIKPYNRNPRRNDAAVNAVANSIREFGWQSPIIVDSDYVIIAGHTRRLAAIKLGITEVPVYVASDMAPEEVQAYRIADNRVAEMALWDMNALRKEIEGIKNLDLEEFGFDREMLDDIGDDMSGVKRHTCPRCGAEWVS